MLSLLIMPEEIHEAQDDLLAIMRQEFPNNDNRNIAFPGGGAANAEVWTDGNYWYRHRFLEGPNITTPRFLNWFGIMNQDPLRIAVEINVVPEGQNNRVQGFFARDEVTGGLYLMHTGNVGGGVQGIGGHAFRAWLGQPRIEAYNVGNNVRLGFTVIPVNAASPTRSLIRYIEQITEFRRLVAVGEIRHENPAFQHILQVHDDYYSEPRGRRAGYRYGEIDYLSRHGEIVDALYEWRRNQGQLDHYRIVKNVFIDMGVENAHGQLVELYEVKTSTARSDVYSAVGQLMIHGPINCSKTVVLPEDDPLADDLSIALDHLDITVLRFIFGDEGATIIE